MALFHSFLWLSIEFSYRVLMNIKLCVCVCVCVYESCSVMFDSLRPRTITCLAPLCMGFSRQEYWSEFPFPSPGDIPNPGIESVSPALTGRFFNIGTTWEARRARSFSTNQCPVRHPKSTGGNKHNGCRKCLSHLHGNWTLSKRILSFFPPKSLLNLLQYCFCLCFFVFVFVFCFLFFFWLQGM